jgi:hypothetical protein
MVFYFKEPFMENAFKWFTKSYLTHLSNIYSNPKFYPNLKTQLRMNGNRQTHLRY